MSPHLPTGRGHLLAYALSAFTTLLWVGCVLPAGRLADPALFDDLATPMHREAWLLVPALVLLVAGPVGMILSQTKRGLASVLGATDAFIAIYMATVLTGWGAFDRVVSGTIVGILYGLGFLSLLETARLLMPDEGLPVATWIFKAIRFFAVALAIGGIVQSVASGDPRLGLLSVGLVLVIESARALSRPGGPVVPRWLRGARLALCLLVLLVPASRLLEGGLELASLLVPYGLITLGAAGALLARTPAGLRLTLALIHFALALHVAIVLRFTIFETETMGHERIVQVNPVGWFTFAVSLAVLLLAFLQVIRLLRHLRRSQDEGEADQPQEAAA